jgi:hypothetical protein
VAGLDGREVRVPLALPAHRVATPVLQRLDGGAEGTVLGAGATAAWVDLGGFVLAVTTREVPMLPNAVGLAAGTGSLAGVAPGGGVRCSPGRVATAGLAVTWDPADPPAWDPTVPVAAVGRQAVGRRGEEVLAALGIRAAPDPAGLVEALAGVGMPTATEPGGAAGLGRLLRAVLDRDPALAAEAAGVLLGRGPGLTPEGDDLLAAVAATLTTLGPATGVTGPALADLLAALVPARTPGVGSSGDGADEGPARSGASGRLGRPPAAGRLKDSGTSCGLGHVPAAGRLGHLPAAGGLAGRTTALAATLLELAARGQVAEPAGRLLDLGPEGERAWPGALRRLERLGHGSGRAYAAGIGAAARLLAAGSGVG